MFQAQHKLLSDALSDRMIHEAIALLVKLGIETRNQALLDHAGKSEILFVKNGRIYPSREAVSECMVHLKENKVVEPDRLGNHHGWQDMIVNYSEGSGFSLRISDLPFQYCDHRAKKIVPLTRKLVVEGTRLIHMLSLDNQLKGYTAGVPQDTAPQLKAIEQYLIGYRYCCNGGGTIQSVDHSVSNEFARIRCIAEDRDDVNARDLMLFSPSPLMLDADDLYLCFQRGIKVNSIMLGSMPMMGMTGPVDPVGVYTLGLAEVIGAAAILHAILPDTLLYVYPHPQAMDPRTGKMAFGTEEHANLEMIKIQIMQRLNLPYYNRKDLMTSAQMPGSMAVADKSLGFYTGIMAGYKAFNIMPLSTDQVWSPVQTLLDADIIHTAIDTLNPSRENIISGNVIDSVEEVISEGKLFAETSDTLLNLSRHYRTDRLLKRFQSSADWIAAESPDELENAEQKHKDLVARWDYCPPGDKLGEIINVYHSLCRQCHTEPLNLE
jgi:hypothetical protein